MPKNRSRRAFLNQSILSLGAISFLGSLTPGRADFNELEKTSTLLSNFEQDIDYVISGGSSESDQIEVRNQISISVDGTPILQEEADQEFVVDPVNLTASPGSNIKIQGFNTEDYPFASPVLKISDLYLHTDVEDILLVDGDEAKMLTTTGPGEFIRVELQTPHSYAEITSNVDNADVFVDEEYVGQTPMLLDSLAPGEYFIEVEKEGYKSETQFVELEPNWEVMLYSLSDRIGEDYTVDDNPEQYDEESKSETNHQTIPFVLEEITETDTDPGETDGTDETSTDEITDDSTNEEGSEDDRDSEETFENEAEERGFLTNNGDLGFEILDDPIHLSIAGFAVSIMGILFQLGRDE